MHFTERLNKLIEDLGADTKTIAAFAGFDRSQLSRLRTGKLIPRPWSSTIEKLAAGLYLFSDNHNGLGQLCAIIGTSANAPAVEIKEGIRNWLFAGTEEEPGSPEPGRKSAGRPRKSRVRMKFFAERLDAAMDLAEISSIRLSKQIHVDASLISRYRSGVRTPEDNPRIVDRLSEILLNRIRRIGHMRELSELMRLPSEEIDNGSFSVWLFNQNELPDLAIPMAESLLASFDSFSEATGPKLPSPEDTALLEIPDTDQSVYYGTEGLRKAVLRFLHDAAAENAAELLLYSDEDQDWLTSDSVFLSHWAGLMSACVRNGTRIRIIHNIDRNLEEMNQAIKSWLPLYMSGMIESYYSRKQRDPRFTHTLFLRTGHACIESFRVIGSMQSIYHYHTEEPELQILASGFEAIMQSAKPLLVIDPPQLYTGNADAAVIQKELTIASMPENLVKEFNHPLLTKAWISARAALLRQLENHILNECVPLASDEDLFAGTVLTESIPGMDPLRYTPRQYAMHIENIVRLSEEYPNYRFYVLPEIPFPNMKLLITESKAQVIHAARPDLSFGFTHPLMCNAFLGYAETLMKQYQMDRNSLRHKLEGRFLQDQ